jgi:hypothetical protein
MNLDSGVLADFYHHQATALWEVLLLLCANVQEKQSGISPPFDDKKAVPGNDFLVFIN